MKYVATILFILMSITGYTQEKKWTLMDCMEYAVKNSPRRSKQEAQNSIYHQNYLEAIGQLLPSINASTSASFNFGRGLDAETNTYTNINSFNNNYNLYSSLTLFDGLANVTRVRLQHVNKLLGRQQLEYTKDMIAYEVMEAFYNVLYNTERVKLAEQELEESTSNLKQVQRMMELGVKGFPEVAEMTAQEAANKYSLTRQKNILIIGVILLKEKMNYPIDETLEVGDAGALDIVVKSDQTAYTIFEHSKSFLPQALVAESSVRVQELAYKSAKGGLFPTIAVEGGYSTGFSRYMDGSEYSSFGYQFKNKMGRYVGFSVRVPIFNGFSRTAEVRRGKAQLVITQAQREETLRVLYSEIEQAVADMNGQVDEYYQAKKQTEAMEVAQKVNERKFSEGLISALELHTSANRLLQARAEELNSQLKFQLKFKLVAYYKGEPFVVED
ncbi:outer membrane protein TolC [Dysgonomonas alginatilytica]|uniref:Outer membrane protein TolC n=1 Tax=Dysgonomonas alginatilytica TaxID=1605892 RepID=A0A2V3PT40_9BACT|nr:TolC family protein [Dysgonomonas alginatilytica]PXV66793.1 outer membrane protein TolC [Dysgonomonas alginatilytica]